MAVTLAVKIWGDVKGLIDGLKTGEKSLKDFDQVTAKTFREVQSQLKAVERAYFDVASAQGANSQAAKNLKAAWDQLKGSADQVKTSLKGAIEPGYFSSLKSEVIGLGVGFFGAQAAISAFVGTVKQAIEGAMEEEAAEKKLAYALDFNTAKTERLLRFKERLMETTLFSEEDIMGAINLAAALGLTEMQIKKVVETAMGWNRATGGAMDLNTAVQALSATYEGNTGKLGKLSEEIKGLSKAQLEAGEGVDILNIKFIKFKSEGLGTLQGDVIQMKKWWNETLEGMGFAVMNFAKNVKFSFDILTTVMAGGTNKAAAEELRLKNQRAQIQVILDNIAAMREQTKVRKEHEKAIKEETSALELYIQFMRNLSSGKVANYPPSSAANLSPIYTSGVTLDTHNTKPSLKNTSDILGGSFDPFAGMSQNKLILTALSSAIDEISGKLGGLLGQFSGVFQGVKTIVSSTAQATKDKWKTAIQGVLEVVSGVMSVISSIISQQFEQRRAAMDDYYSTEREKVQNSLKPEEQKRKELQKLDKEQEKKRKELTREQAKDAKITALMQAIINGALAVVMALASTKPPANFILAAIVGALAAVNIALIASQPLPALAQGGLAYAPTMALVGDNPNARINPEVIAPLDKLQAIMVNAVNGGQLSARVAGSDLLFVLDRATEGRKRTRGY